MKIKTHHSIIATLIVILIISVLLGLRFYFNAIEIEQETKEIQKQTEEIQKQTEEIQKEIKLTEHNSINPETCKVRLKESIFSESGQLITSSDCNFDTLLKLTLNTEKLSTDIYDEYILTVRVDDLDIQLNYIYEHNGVYLMNSTRFSVIRINNLSFSLDIDLADIHNSMYQELRFNLEKYQDL
jgi:predicted nucleic acid-binding protein